MCEILEMCILVCVCVCYGWKVDCVHCGSSQCISLHQFPKHINFDACVCKRTSTYARIAHTICLHMYLDCIFLDGNSLKLNASECRMPMFIFQTNLDGASTYIHVQPPEYEFDEHKEQRDTICITYVWNNTEIEFLRLLHFLSLLCVCVASLWPSHFDVSF